MLKCNMKFVNLSNDRVFLLSTISYLMCAIIYMLRNHVTSVTELVWCHVTVLCGQIAPCYSVVWQIASRYSVV